MPSILRRPTIRPPPPAVRRRGRPRPPRATGSETEEGAGAPSTTGDKPPASFRAYPACRLLAQALAVSLPLGAGGVQLIARALYGSTRSTPALSADQLATAASVTEGLTLAAVVALFRAAAARPEGGVRLPSYESTLETVLLGGAGAVGGALAAAACSAAWEAARGSHAAAVVVGVSPSTAAVGQLLEAASPGGAAALFAASAVGAPAVEELIYRGLILPALLDCGLGVPAAVGLSAAAFAASHGAVAPAGDLPALFGLGAALGVTAVAAGRLHGRAPVDVAAPTLAHGLYNAGLLVAAIVGGGGGGT